MKQVSHTVFEVAVNTTSAFILATLVIGVATFVPGMDGLRAVFDVMGTLALCGIALCLALVVLKKK